MLKRSTVSVNVQDRHHVVSLRRPAVRPQVWLLDLLWLAGWLWQRVLLFFLDLVQIDFIFWGFIFTALVVRPSVFLSSKTRRFNINIRLSILQANMAQLTGSIIPVLIQLEFNTIHCTMCWLFGFYGMGHSFKIVSCWGLCQFQKHESSCIFNLGVLDTGDS